MKDGLERLFYKYLRQQLPEDADWNAPSDEVWLQVEKALGENQERRRPFLWLWLAIGLLSLGLLFVLYHLEHLHTEMKEVHHRAAVAVKPLEQIEKSKVEKERKWIEDKEGENKPATWSESGFSRVVEKSDKSGLSAGNEVIRADRRTKEAAGEETKSPLVSHLAKAPKHSNSVRQSGMVALLPLGFLGVGEVAYQDARTFEGFSVAFERAWEKEKSVNPFFLYAYAGLSETFAPVKGQMSNGFEAMVDSDKGMTSLHWAVDVGRKFNKSWGVFTGLHYGSLKLWSLSKVQAVFDSSGEVPDASGFMKSSQLFSIPSSVGMMKKEMVLRYPSSLGIQSGDLLEAQVEVINDLQGFQFPLGVIYERPLWKRFSLSARLGVAWNVVFKSEAKLIPVVMYQGYSLQIEAPNQVETSFPNHWSVFGDMSVFCNLSPSCSLGLRTAYSREIRPHFQLEDMHSSLFSLGLSSGIFYRF